MLRNVLAMLCEQFIAQGIAQILQETHKQYHNTHTHAPENHKSDTLQQQATTEVIGCATMNEAAIGLQLMIAVWGGGGVCLVKMWVGGWHAGELAQASSVYLPKERSKQYFFRSRLCMAA